MELATSVFRDDPIFKNLRFGNVVLELRQSSVQARVGIDGILRTQPQQSAQSFEDLRDLSDFNFEREIIRKSLDLIADAKISSARSDAHNDLQHFFDSTDSGWPCPECTLVNPTDDTKW